MSIDQFPLVQWVTSREEYERMSEDDQAAFLTQLVSYLDEIGDTAASQYIRSGGDDALTWYFESQAADAGASAAGAAGAVLDGFDWEAVNTDFLFSFDLSRFFDDPVAYLDSATPDELKVAMDMGLLRFEPAEDE